MKRILIIANTYYQMIMAMQLNVTIFKNDEVVLFLSDDSRNTEAIAEKLNETRFFKEVHFIHTIKEPPLNTVSRKIHAVCDILFTSHNKFNTYFQEMSNLYFDELIFFNHGMWLYYVYSILYEKNHDILISRYEEGIISYDSPLFHLSNEKKVGGCILSNQSA